VLLKHEYLIIGTQTDGSTLKPFIVNVAAPVKA